VVINARPFTPAVTLFTKNKIKKGFGKVRIGNATRSVRVAGGVWFSVLPFQIRSRFAPKWFKIFAILGPFPNYLQTKIIFYLFLFFIISWMPKRAKAVFSLSADLFKNPRQIRTVHHQHRSISSLRTVLNKKFINSSPRHRMTNDPVFLTTVGDPHQQNGSQKWASSLATPQQTVINGGGHHHAPHHKHASPPSSFYPKDKASTMGNPLNWVWKC
jgi:hypothetical protein